MTDTPKPIAEDLKTPEPIMSETREQAISELIKRTNTDLSAQWVRDRMRDCQTKNRVGLTSVAVNALEELAAEQSKVRDLEAKCTKRFNQLAEMSSRNFTLEAENGRLRDALEWKPITPESLPNVGDEVWSPTRNYYSFYAVGKSTRSALGEIVEPPESSDLESLTGRGFGYTHFRPINAPQPAPEQKEKP